MTNILSVIEGDVAKVEGWGKPWPMKVFVCFYKDWPCNLNQKICTFLLQATPTVTPPFCQLAWRVNQLSFGSWTTFPLNYVQVCESIQKFCMFWQRPLPLPRPLGWALTHTFTHTHTLDLHVIFQPLKAKTVAAKEWGIFVDRLTERHTELLVVAKNISDRKQKVTEQYPVYNGRWKDIDVIETRKQLMPLLPSSPIPIWTGRNSMNNLPPNVAKQNTRRLLIFYVIFTYKSKHLSQNTA